MDYSIEINHLNKSYNTFSLNDVSFKVPTGSIMGFIGENGAGKSTTIKSMLNLIKIQSGNIKLLGDTVTEKNDKELKQEIGVVFDETHFHDMLTVDNIQSILEKIYNKWDTMLYYKYIEQFQIPKDKTIKEFSRGMKMKLSIATALSHQPKLLILDEATSGLDPIVRNEILDVFQDYIQDESRSILMSSHITSDLERICDYITFIHNGSIVLSEAKDDVLYRHKLVRCSKNDFSAINPEYRIGYRCNSFGYEVLVNNTLAYKHLNSHYVAEQPSLDDIMLFYIRREKSC